ncbi:hypothetical protein LZ32DRAFT_667805 [Colletotrichum eremochloae]|nr:hypothetical protein LZ32DRAFT_667805 [Colletotrichum eremochloae]
MCVQRRPPKVQGPNAKTESGVFRPQYLKIDSYQICRAYESFGSMGLTHVVRYTDTLGTTAVAQTCEQLPEPEAPNDFIRVFGSKQIESNATTDFAGGMIYTRPTATNSGLITLINNGRTEPAITCVTPNATSSVGGACLKAAAEQTCTAPLSLTNVAFFAVFLPDSGSVWQAGHTSAGARNYVMMQAAKASRLVRLEVVVVGLLDCLM